MLRLFNNDPAQSDLVLSVKKRFREMENVLVARDGDEELSLFLEMRRREKFQDVSSLPEPGELLNLSFS